MLRKADNTTTLSVIVVSHNEGAWLRRTVESLSRTLPDYAEIVVVDDASTDGSSVNLPPHERLRVFRPRRRIGVSRARNLGARRSLGRVLIFSDAHVIVPNAWAPPLMNTIQRAEVGAVGPVLTSIRYPDSKGYGLTYVDAGLNIEWLDLQRSNPYAVPLLGGFFLGVRREVFEEVGGFDVGMTLWGMEDLEFCTRLWMYGYSCLLVPSVDVSHLDRERGTYPPYQCDWENGVHNVLRLAFVHFGDLRMRQVWRFYSTDHVFPAALARLCTSDAWQRREEVRARSVHDDDWYFQKFSMKLKPH